MQRQNRVKRIAAAALATVALTAAVTPITAVADPGSVQTTSEPGGGGTGP